MTCIFLLLPCKYEPWEPEALWVTQGWHLYIMLHYICVKPSADINTLRYFTLELKPGLASLPGPPRKPQGPVLAQPPNHRHYRRYQHHYCVIISLSVHWMSKPPDVADFLENLSWQRLKQGRSKLVIGHFESFAFFYKSSRWRSLSNPSQITTKCSNFQISATHLWPWPATSKESLVLSSSDWFLDLLINLQLARRQCCFKLDANTWIRAMTHNLLLKLWIKA